MFKLPDLPYDYAALEPVISQATMHLHHDKHHKRYFDVTNQIVEEQGLSGSLEDLVRGAAGKAESRKLFNNAAQAWNHTFFWVCMSGERQAPDGELAAAIGRDLGGLEKLKTDFVAKGVGHFGSGWVWLAAKRDGTLVIVDSHDGENLLSDDGVLPLLVCDLWEHAYYLDHKNDREGFLKAWFDALPNWKFAGEQYNAAKSGGKGWQHP
ncbi:superoxide dismutase [Phenylobacterium sp.]|uniref:superoxide dismutase n=1 Tax=Phenylobacterium sp. TaxID=1871053 RepID=UPI0035AEE052